MQPTCTFASISKKQRQLLPSQYVDTANSFEEYVEGQPELMKRLLKQILFVPGGEKMLWKCLSENHCLKAASDGLWDRHLELASFGWLLLGNGNVLVCGTGLVDGIADAMSSMRAELFGFGSLTEFLYHFQKYNGIQESQSRLMMWIDNKVALQRINRMRREGSRKCRMCHDANIVVHTKDSMRC